MVVISAGMQKSGSAYFYNLLNDILHLSGHADAREVKANYHLDQLMRWANNNIDRPDFIKLSRLYRISQRAGTFVVKTHSGPTLVSRIFSMLGAIKIIYIYRDPRDALLSALDHGQRILAEGKSHTFAGYANFDSALPVVKTWAKNWHAYQNMPGVHMIRYEDLLDNPDTGLKSFKAYLGIHTDDEKRQQIIWKFDRNNKQALKNGLHFNKAQVTRWMTELNEQQKKQCNRVLGKYLVPMGYKLY